MFTTYAKVGVAATPIVSSNLKPSEESVSKRGLERPLFSFQMGWWACFRDSLECNAIRSCYSNQLQVALSNEGLLFDEFSSVIARFQEVETGRQ